MVSITLPLIAKGKHGPTIEDVTRAAGISVATVVRVPNGRSKGARGRARGFAGGRGGGLSHRPGDPGLPHVPKLHLSVVLLRWRGIPVFSLLSDCAPRVRPHERRRAECRMPGDPEGAIDFTPLLKILAGAGHDGWLVIEAEQDPEVRDPLASQSMG